MMRYINLALFAMVIFLGYLLWETINEPIRFQKIKKERYEDVKNRLIDVRTAQLAFKDLHGRFADNFDELIHSIKTDSMTVIKTIGDPNDTTIVTYYDTSKLALKDSVFQRNFAIDSIQYIPHGQGKKFLLSAGRITKARIKVQVFEAVGPDTLFMKDILEDYGDYIDWEHTMQVGSMTEATTTGNWE